MHRDGLTRPPRPLRVTPLLALVPLVATLGGCGSATDRGGFTSSERAAAQTALDTLKNTSVTTIVLHTSAVSGLPSVCTVGLLSRKPMTFRLLMGWRGRAPAYGVGVDSSWLVLEVGEGGPNQHNWRLHTAQDARAYTAALRDSTTKPYQNCQILSSGRLNVLPVG
jgi:hypothetical protein